MSEWIDLTLEDLAANKEQEDEAGAAKRIAQEARQKVERARKLKTSTPRLPGMEDFPEKDNTEAPTTTIIVAEKNAEKFLRPVHSSMSPQRPPSPVTLTEHTVQPLDTPSSSKQGPIPREKLPVRVASSIPASPKQDESDDDAVLGMVRRVGVGHWQVRTPDGTILDSSFPTSESAHMALAALDEMRRKEQKLKKKISTKDMFAGLKRMPDSYYNENRRRPSKRSRSRSPHPRKRRFRSRSPPRQRQRSRSVRRRRRGESPSPPPPLRRRANRRSRSYSAKRSFSPRRAPRKRRRSGSRDRMRHRGRYSDGGYRGPKRRRTSHRRNSSKHQPTAPPPSSKSSNHVPLQTIVEVAEDAEPSPKVFGPAPPGGEAKKKWNELRHRSPSREDVREKEPKYVEQVPIRKFKKKNFITSHPGKVEKPKRPIIIEKRVNREVVLITKEPVVTVNYSPNLEREKRRVEINRKLLQKTKQIQLKQLKSLLKKSMKQKSMEAKKSQEKPKTAEEAPVTAPAAPTPAPTIRTEEEMNLLRQKALASMRNRRTVQMMKTNDEEETKKPSQENETSASSDVP